MGRVVGIGSGGGQQFAEGCAGRVASGDECPEQKGGTRRVPQGSVLLAARGELGDLLGELVAVEEPGEAVAFLARMGEAGEAQGVQKADGPDRRASSP
jgi:hypothetical protein